MAVTVDVSPTFTDLLSLEPLAGGDDKRIGWTPDCVKCPEIAYFNMSLGEYK